MKAKKLFITLIFITLIILPSHLHFTSDTSSNVSTYSLDNKNYIEINDNFDDGILDTELWSSFYTDGLSTSNIVESDGVLNVSGKSMIKLVDTYNQYDYVEIQIDQIGDTVEKGGIGFSTDGYWDRKFSFIQRLYDGNNYTYNVFYTHDRENGWGNLGKSFKQSKADNYAEYTTVISGLKNANGNFDLTIKIYPLGQTDGEALSTVTNSGYDEYHKIYDFEDIYLGKNMNTKNNQASVAYLDNFHLKAYILNIIFEDFTADTNIDTNSIDFAWTLSNEFINAYDKLSIYETINGIDTLLIDNIDKNTTIASTPINSTLGNRAFKIVAIKDTNPATQYSDLTTSWMDTRKTITINKISAHTGKLLESSEFSGFRSLTPIMIDLSLDKYKISHSNTNLVSFIFGSSDKTINIMYIKNADDPPSSSTWELEALESINDYSNTDKVDFFENSYYETLFNSNDLDANQAQIDSNLDDDFLRILTETSVLNLKAHNISKYIDAILDESNVDTLEKLQLIIDNVNGPTSLVYKDGNSDELELLENNIKSSVHGYDLNIIAEIDLSRGSFYQPVFEFTLNGNNYLTYEAPELTILDADKKQIQSITSTEYDLSESKFYIKLSPSQLNNEALTNGIYYILLNTKTKVNPHNPSVQYTTSDGENRDQSVKDLMNLSDITKSKKNWEFPYFISQIKDESISPSVNIVDDLSIDTSILYKQSLDSDVPNEYFYDNLIINLEDKKIIPGGF